MVVSSSVRLGIELSGFNSCSESIYERTIGLSLFLPAALNSPAKIFLDQWTYDWFIWFGCCWPYLLTFDSGFF